MNRKTDQILDELIVLRAQKGDETAVRMLVRRWHTPLLRHASRLTKHREAAADVTQEVWIAVFRGLHRLSDPTQFRAWAYRIVQNKSVDWIRSQSQQRKTNREVATQLPRDDSANRSDPSAGVDELRIAIDRLPDDKQVLLRMIYEDGMTLKEVSEVVGVPVGTLKYQLHELRKSLRKSIERDRS